VLGLNPDFRDMLRALSAEGAEFLVVGAYAMGAHGVPRATGDLDIWVGTSGDNPDRVWRALSAFGAPLEDLRIDDLRREDLVFQIGVAPQRVDIMTSIEAVTFTEAYPRRVSIDAQGTTVPVLSRQDLIRNKRAVGRPKDLADLDALGESPA
jgi:hypothetical protein